MSHQTLATGCSPAELLTHVLTVISNDEKASHHLPFVLTMLVNHRLLCDSSEAAETVQRKWTVRLNALLQSKQASTRWAAVTLVKVTCEQSPRLYMTHLRSWSAQLLGFVAKPEPTMIHAETIRTLSWLFTQTVDKPELQREVTTPNLPRFNQALLTLAGNAELLPTVLDALIQNIKHFPSVSRHITDPCLKLCLSCLEGTVDLESATLEKVGQCLASLYRTSGKTNMAEQWKDTLMRLIGSIHLSLERLFDTVDEENLPTFTSSPFPRDPLEAFPILLKRVQALGQCITTFLSMETAMAVSVPVVHLIDLLCRIYNVYEGTLMREYKDKSEYSCLMGCLPTLHSTANKIFASLLYCSGAELSRYSKLFSQILLRLLSEHKHKRTLKISTYNLVSLCLQMCGLTFGEIICKPLSTRIIEDITINEQNSSALASTNSFLKSKSRKRRHDELTHSDALANEDTSSSSQCEVPLAALGALEQLLNVYGSSMDPQTRSALDSIILSRLLSSIHPGKASAEMINVTKHQLYKCLLSSVLHPVATQASILPHAMRLFSSGLNESNHELRSTCLQGMTICELIIHPRMPPVQRTMPRPTVPVNLMDEPEIAAVIESADTEMASPPADIPAAKRVETSMPAATSIATSSFTEKMETSQISTAESPAAITATTTEPVTMEITQSEPTSVAAILDSAEAKSEDKTVAKDTSVAEEAVASRPEPAVPATIDIMPAVTSSDIATASTSKTKTTVAPQTSISDDDLDEDMEGMPDIDLAGPDTDEDED
ncbi:rRNA processing/ribosome biogenesis-domain-containing protein [Radiomyces spectabilis]|uniref:rRNA processing/ribosome biogenesis-domain-containing protein n=1 Tax=Radiomyces spectabilis TaxID=64574 RepID=UPI00221FBEDE|nr:rRNA processing/ribosome biogenesis-domain-containing protein [Radiomyces spectabilis]KAI8369294.1 rRNA processing/ribosome biogenesis-domain-containing protein [Radiomyces spectabilis]